MTDGSRRGPERGLLVLRAPLCSLWLIPTAEETEDYITWSAGIPALRTATTGMPVHRRFQRRAAIWWNLSHDRHRNPRAVIPACRWWSRPEDAPSFLLPATARPGDRSPQSSVRSLDKHFA